MTPAHAHERAGSDARGARSSCVIIDNDLDIDDLMAIPLVVGNARVVAIVQSEGYSLPGQAAPVVDRLVNHGPGRRAGHHVPVIVGGSQAQSPDLSRWPWLPFFRAMMSRGNGLLTSPPTPWPADSQYPQKVADAVRGCRSVSVLVIGTYTSFINYLPLLKDRFDRVVVMGQMIGDMSRTPGRESFNCVFDFEACQTAMPVLDGVNTSFVDIPRFDDCHDTATPAARCYNPNLQMVMGLSKRGLPGRLRKALLNPISCSQLYTAPAAQGRPCSSRSTWEPVAVTTGVGGEMLLWDQTAALFLLRPQDFSLYFPPDDPGSGGKHYEPTLVDGSDEKTVQKLRAMWTSLTNVAARRTF